MNIRIFTRYVVARLEDENREMIYRFFVTQSLRLLPQNKYLTKNLFEMLGDIPEETRTGDEIAQEFIAMSGLKVVS